MTQLDYYRQPELWAAAPDPYQIQVRADLLDLLPADAGSILDIGCGDGFHTNALPAEREVVGLDASDVAARRVGRRVVVGSALALPFADASFDLVMANDLLEHLDDAALAAVLGEMQRVARRYVLVTVPLLEDLRAAQVHCAGCGARFHANHHVRSWDEPALVGLLAPAFAAHAVRYTGALLTAPPDPCFAMLRAAGIHHHWRHAQCPACGWRAGSAPPAGTTETEALLDHLRARAWWGRDPAAARHVDRSELMVLYGRGATPRSDGARPAVESRDLLTIDFGNACQEVADWTPGATLARWRAAAGCRIEGGALVADAEPPHWFNTAFPIEPAAGDELVVEGDDAGMVRPFAWDPVLGLETELAPSEEPGVFALPQAFHASRFGALIDVHLAPGARVRRLRYRPRTGAVEVPFVRVAAGHTVVPLGNGGERSLGLHSESAGLLPMPRWMACVRPAQPAPLDLHAVVALAEGLRAHARAGALAGSGRVLELEREAVSLRREVERLRRRLVPSRRVQRVLVLANWFPSAAQPGLGSFVLEQVQALREHTLLDVRVVAGRPFWVNTLHPTGIVCGVRGWRQAMRAIGWREHDGVPVLDVPYLVGRPFPVRTHAATYSAAVARAMAVVGGTFRFDLVHAHTAYLDGSAAIRVARAQDVPVVLTEHTGPFVQLMRSWSMRRRTLRTITQVDRCFAVSPALAAEIASWLPAAMADRVQVLRNGVDTRLFRPPAAWRADPERPRIVSIGAFEAVKNSDLLLAAFARVLQRRPGAELHLIGDGPLAAAVGQRAADPSLRGAVRLHGRLSRAEVAAFLRERCDLLVISSRTETFGMAALEALACGKPVVATRCGGPESIVSGPDLGRLCANGDTEALVAALLDVVERLPEFVPERLHRHVAAHFALDGVAGELAAIYEDVAVAKAAAAR